MHHFFRSSVMSAYQEWQDELVTKSQTIIKTNWPETCQKLQIDIHSKRFAMSRVDEVRKASIVTTEASKAGQKRKRTDDDDVKTNGDTNGGPLPLKFKDNSIILGLFDEQKKLALQLVDELTTVRMWITLNVPKIEDGNNFGVSVQEEILSELKNVETEFEAMWEL